MSIDQYDDIRALLRSAEPDGVPAYDAEAIMAAGAGARRRRVAEQWLAVAAVAVLLTVVGVVVTQAARRDAAPPVAPTPTASAGFRPVPLTADQWLQFSQVSVNEATSVHVVQTLAPGLVVDLDIVPGGGKGTVTAKDVTSRCINVGGQQYVEPQVLVALGDAASRAIPSGSWVRLTQSERFAFLCSGGANPGNGWGRQPVLGPDDVVDGRTVKTVTFDVTDMWPGARRMTYYIDAQAPYLPLRVVLDGQEVGRFTSWNTLDAPAPTPPPAASVVDLPPRA